MPISPLLLIIVVFAGIFLFVAGLSYFFGSGTNLEASLGSIVAKVFPSFQTTTTTQFNQTKCTLSGGKCLSINTISALSCKLEFLDEAFCGKGFKCCIPR